MASLPTRGIVGDVDVPHLEADSVYGMVLECLRVDGVDHALTEFVRDHANGNPFAVEELVAGLVRSGAIVRDGVEWRVQTPLLQTFAPPTVAASVARRLAVLPARTRTVLSAAAVLGHRFDWQLIAPITRLSDDHVAVALREALDEGLVANIPHGVCFRHALTRRRDHANDAHPGEAHLRATRSRPGGWTVRRAHRGAG